jgi:hypothetical protein
MTIIAATTIQCIKLNEPIATLLRPVTERVQRT